MPKATYPQIISANDLLEGDVVYLTQSGDWSRHITEAQLVKDATEGEAALARADQPESVVGPYLLPVAIDASGQVVPVHFREQFREHGPTHRGGLQRMTGPVLEPRQAA